MKNHIGRPSLNPDKKTVYVPLGSVGMSPEQAETFKRLVKAFGSKAEAIRNLIQGAKGRK